MLKKASEYLKFIQNFIFSLQNTEINEFLFQVVFVLFSKREEITETCESVTLTKKCFIKNTSSKEFLDTQTTIVCGFALKRVCDMTRTYSQMHRTDRYSQNSSIIWPVWLNGRVFVYKLSGCGFESTCRHFMKFLIKYFSSTQNLGGLLSLTEQISKDKLHFLFNSVSWMFIFQNTYPGMDLHWFIVVCIIHII